MIQLIEYKDVKKEYLLVDVRSEGEYEECTISGAYNLPILNNEERKYIGTLYKHDIEKAKIEAVKIGARKLPSIVESFFELQKQYEKIVIFCARGGMRSGVLGDMLSSLGIKVFKLHGGYKYYRKFISQNLPLANENIKYVMLHGNTGVGKTKILNELKYMSYDILDLEQCANHRGSLLGDVGLSKIQSQKQFESNLYESLINRKSNIVFVEAESKRIGNVIIPTYIYDSMIRGEHIFIDADLQFRTKIILEEYLKEDTHRQDILDCLNKLGKYISEKNVHRYREMIIDNQYDKVVEELMVKYYDPMYTHTSNQYDYELKLHINNIHDAAENIEKWYRGYFPKKCEG